LYRQITKREYIDGIVLLVNIHSPYESNWETCLWETTRKVHQYFYLCSAIRIKVTQYDYSFNDEPNQQSTLPFSQRRWLILHDRERKACPRKDQATSKKRSRANDGLRAPVRENKVKQRGEGGEAAWEGGETAAGGAAGTAGAGGAEEARGGEAATQGGDGAAGVEEEGWGVEQEGLGDDGEVEGDRGAEEEGGCCEGRGEEEAAGGVLEADRDDNAGVGIGGREEEERDGEEGPGEEGVLGEGADWEVEGSYIEEDQGWDEDWASEISCRASIVSAEIRIRKKRISSWEKKEAIRRV
jgi:hypothetical protein